MACDLHPKPYKVSDVLARAGISQIADRKVNKLSGGQEQRVRFALATAGANDLIVLDEPTTGMDVSARQAFWATMREQADQGRTVLFATHYLEEADAIADRVLVLHRGRLLADGTAAEIKAKAGARRIAFDLEGPIHEAPLGALPFATSIDVSGHTVRIQSSDADADRTRAVRARPLPAQSRSRRARARAGLRRHHGRRGGEAAVNSLIKLEYHLRPAQQEVPVLGGLPLGPVPADRGQRRQHHQGGRHRAHPADLLHGLHGLLRRLIRGPDGQQRAHREGARERLGTAAQAHHPAGCGYVLAKTASAAVISLPSIVVVFAVAAAVKHVRLDAWQWSAPPARSGPAALSSPALGVAIGYLASGDAVRPITMILYFGLSVLGGLGTATTTFPDWLQKIASGRPRTRTLPSGDPSNWATPRTRRTSPSSLSPSSSSRAARHGCTGRTR